MNQTDTIRTRIGYGGTHAKIECIEGIIPDITPFQLFKSIWNRMKDEKADATIFESWFPLYKTTEWNEQISIASILSGSSIISRYLNLSDSKGSVKQRTMNMKCKKKELIQRIQQMKSKSQMTEGEINSLAIEDAFIFFISNYSPIDSQLKKEKLNIFNYIFILSYY